MKQFLLLHFGFEPPSPDVMAQWGKWFEAVAPRTVANVGLGNAVELTREGSREIPMGLDAITGYTLLEAESLEEATALAEGNPFVKAIRICEVREH